MLRLGIHKMLKELESDIKQIKICLQGLGFVFKKKTISHNNLIIAINDHFQEISLALVNQRDQKLFVNVSILSGAITAKYVHIQTLKEAVHATKLILKYIKQYLKV